jgi:hypothetical protein
VPVQYALELPIPVTAAGSTVRYAFETEDQDVNFGVFLRGPGGGEEEEELLPTERVASHLGPVTGSFLVPAAPGVVLLCWDNQ